MTCFKFIIDQNNFFKVVLCFIPQVPDAISLEDCVPSMFLNYDGSTFSGYQSQYQA
ncbi:hypothetical protein RchiOBHm_Chr4g0432341 [Rosa chinensis]|uniref:Uncharacterized protein n=1 Tax=Rosa chinensis TaxID=74649 RepID=A0A2P6R106_ROSCH|nr:hypothetical protein RchiOBHm_Chr4g0432341 [Rosa chinensis]